MLNIDYQPRVFCKNVRIIRIKPNFTFSLVPHWNYPANVTHPRIYSDHSRAVVRFWSGIDQAFAGSMWVSLARSNMPHDMHTAYAFFQSAIVEILASL